MLGSVRLGLSAAEARGAEAVLLHPVDHPAVEPATIDAVCRALAEGALVAVPTFDGRRGHPGGFSRALFPELHRAPPEAGARAVLAADPSRVVHVAGGPGSVAGVDVPGDLARLPRA
jgi:CTP:molybdopterin cytidylyltransferase MocA